MNGECKYCRPFLLYISSYQHINTANDIKYIVIIIKAMLTNYVINIHINKYKQRTFKA